MFPNKGLQTDRLAGIRGSFEGRVTVSEPFPGQPPLWIEPLDPTLRSDVGAASAWMREHREAIEAALLSFGAIVWRGFPVVESDDFAALMSAYDAYSMGYTGGTSDRQSIKGQVMEATRTPSNVYILLHQEMSYLPDSPRLLAFYCKEPSAVGGETVICDMRGLLDDLPAPLARKLLEQDIRYVRNMRSERVDDWRAKAEYRHPSWQYRFATNDPSAVETQLAERGAAIRWEGDGSLTFWTERPGFVEHPVTRERLFFNQITSQAQHRVSIGDARAAFVDAAYGHSVARPYSVAFADGQPLADDDFMAIHEAFERRKVSFAWQPGDVMLVENKLTAHGRHPYEGSRNVQVMLLQ